MIRELIKDVDKLTVRSKEYDVGKDKDKLVESVVNDLCDTLNSMEDRLYLTANQIGYAIRAIAIKFDKETNVYFNPVYKSRDHMIIFREKDLLTGKEYLIPRFTEVSLLFQDYTGKARGYKFNEASSIVVCQAFDAVEGILVSDYGLEIIPEFDEASDEEKQEVIAEYMSSIESMYNTLDKELEDNSETSKSWNQAKFIAGTLNGDVQFEQKPLSNKKKRLLKRLFKRLGKKFNESDYN